MQIASHEIDECDLRIPKKLVNEEDEIDIDDFEQDGSIECQPDFEDDNELEFPENCETLQRGYLKFKDPRNPNKQMMMRKSEYVWHLTEGTKKISSDRTIRVQDTSRDTQVQRDIHDSTSLSKKSVNVFHHIKIGDWCFFKADEIDSG